MKRNACLFFCCENQKPSVYVFYQKTTNNIFTKQWSVVACENIVCFVSPGVFTSFISFCYKKCPGGAVLSIIDLQCAPNWALIVPSFCLKLDDIQWEEHADHWCCVAVGNLVFASAHILDYSGTTIVDSRTLSTLADGLHRACPIVSSQRGSANVYLGIDANVSP